MNWEDAAISVGLIVLVLRQVRGRAITMTSLLWPVGLVVWAAYDYLGAIPNYRADWLFTAGLAATGLALGIGCGLLTTVYAERGRVMARARRTAAALWVFGMGSRLVFGIVALHGGGEAIGRLSNSLGLHSANTWPTALIVMALGEVLSRTAIMFTRYRRVEAAIPAGERAAAKAADEAAKAEKKARRKSGRKSGGVGSPAATASTPSRPRPAVPAGRRPAA